MKIYQSLSFAKQLIIYLSVLLIIAFILIFCALINSTQQFISNNAYKRTQAFIGNVANVFEKQIFNIESIPCIQNITSFQSGSKLPAQLLKTHPQLIECSFYAFSVQYPDSSLYSIAKKEYEKIIYLPADTQQSIFSLPHRHQILRKNTNGSFWAYSHSGKIPTIAYYHPALSNQQGLSYFKLDFPLKTLTRIIHDNKMNEYTDTFIIDSLGNHLSNSFDTPYFQMDMKSPLIQKMIKGETYSGKYYFNDKKYFIYFSPLSSMNWRLGVICPYNNILNSSFEFYEIIFIYLVFGLIFLFIGVTNIVRHLSYPLKQLAYNVKQATNENPSVEISMLKSSNEIAELYKHFHHMQHNLISNVEKRKVFAKEENQIKSEMKHAHRVQQRLISHPVDLPNHIQLVAELHQSKEIGGDFYDIFRHDNRLYFTIGDVSGKGTPAALYMASFCKLLRYIVDNQTSTATICNILNQHMSDDIEDGAYISMFLGILNISTGEITYTNAGFPHPLVIDENGDIHSFYRKTDSPIGIFKNYNFIERTYTLHEGNSLLLYTDGAIDMENPAKEFYEKENFMECIKSVATSTPQIIIHTLLEDINRHIAGGNQSDDFTLFLLRFDSPTGNPG